MLRGTRSNAISTTDVLLLVMTIIWGTNFAVVKQTLGEMLPLTFNAMRFSLASLFLSLAVILSRQRFLPDRKDFKGTLVLGLIGHTCYQLLFIYGIARTSASLSSLMLATSPVFVAVMSLLVTREKPSARLLSGVSLSLAGVSILMVGSQSGLMSVEGDVLGAVLVLVGAMCWAAYTVFSKPYLARYSPLKLTTITMVFGTMVLDVLAIPSFLAQRWAEVSLVGWAGLMYSFGLAIVFGYVIWEIGIDRVGPERTAVYQNLIPVVAAIVSYVLLGETLGGLQIGGAGMVLLGIYLTKMT